MSDESVPAPATERYIADALVIYGVKLNESDSYANFDVGEGFKSELRIQLYRSGNPVRKGDYSIVLAYGYAFDGHGYRFDSNRVFLITGPKPQKAVGCGFEIDGYMMWRIQASSQLLEIATKYSDAQSLILDAQLPGKRSPSSYAITQSMAHRDGRFTKD
ncbi:hypothetical protein HB775_07565 [Rhizobium leguminosarum bv. trifolii]|nr:hypothetical protein HB775_07565 [Rhizobium leguminosarum bv. trifolii]